MNTKNTYLRAILALAIGSGLTLSAADDSRPDLAATAQRKIRLISNQQLLHRETEFAHNDLIKKMGKFTPTAAIDPVEIPTFKSWKELCDNLPQFTPLEQNIPKSSEQYCTPLSKKMLLDAVTEFKNLRNDELSKSQWVGDKPDNYFYDLSHKEIYDPYVQKIALSDGTDCAFHGDLHGDVHSLNAFLQYLTEQKYIGGDTGFKIIKDAFRMVFLGDYTDRGWYGAEVLYTILRLKNENPESVLLVRGNHEDMNINLANNFHEELVRKFNLNFSETADIYRLYNYLPVALFLGSQSDNAFILCCHGGLEIGYNSKELLADQRPSINQLMGDCLQRTHVAQLRSTAQEALKNMPLFDSVSLDPIHALKLEDRDKRIRNIGQLNPLIAGRPGTNESVMGKNGFMWNDFNVKPDGTAVFVNGSRGFKFGKTVTEAVLEDLYSNKKGAHVAAVFRAHQHGDPKMMQSIHNIDNESHPKDTGISRLWRDKTTPNKPGKLWPGIICTFSVSPNSTQAVPYNYTYNAFGILSLKETFDTWKLKTVRIDQNGAELSAPTHNDAARSATARSID